MLDIKTVYLQNSAKKLARTDQILSNFPKAKVIPVTSHWNIPQLHLNKNSLEDWTKNKKNVLVIGTKGKLYVRENGRSTDFIAPSHANGCTMACSYCYVARRKGYANPITVFSNIDEILDFTKKHVQSLGVKQPNQCDPKLWTYDIGENSDCSIDATISDNVKDFIQLFAQSTRAKICFATKYVNRDLLKLSPKQRTRIRFSLMPQSMSTVVDVRTSKISDRIQAINDFVDAGYEVHVNFSPVIIHKDWQANYTNLFTELNDNLSNKSKNQLKCEVIFLTHNKELHQINKKWHPKAEEYLWDPTLQEDKISQTGGKNVRYKRSIKGAFVNQFKQMIHKQLPYCNIRYAF